MKKGKGVNKDYIRIIQYSHEHYKKFSNVQKKELFQKNMYKLNYSRSQPYKLSVVVLLHR